MPFEKENNGYFRSVKKTLKCYRMKVICTMLIQKLLSNRGIWLKQRLIAKKFKLII